MRASEILDTQRAVAEMHKREALEECRSQRVLTKAEIEALAGQTIVVLQDLSAMDTLRVLARAHRMVLDLLIRVSRGRLKA